MTKAAAQEIWSFKGQLEEKLLQRPMTIKKQSQIEKKKKKNQLSQKLQVDRILREKKILT